MRLLKPFISKISGLLDVSLSPEAMYFIFGDTGALQIMQTKFPNPFQTYCFGKFEIWEIEDLGHVLSDTSKNFWIVFENLEI